MPQQTLYFNILTFDYPKEEQVFYFNEKPVGLCTGLYKTLFPNNIEEIFPGIITNGTEKIYTTYTIPEEGYTPLAIDFRTENHDLLRRYYNRRINDYFKLNKGHLVKVGKIGQNQVWVPAPEFSNDEFDVYYKFSLKIQFENVSSFPELQLSYDGRAKVFKKNAIELTMQVSPSAFKWFVREGQLLTDEQIKEEEDPDYTTAYPVLNFLIAQELQIQPDPKPDKTKYDIYRDQIKMFYTDHLNNDDFKAIIPVHDSGFLRVPQSLIHYVPDESNELQYELGKGRFPKRDFVKKRPYKSVKENVHLFFVYHQDDEEAKNRLQKCFESGLGHYGGLTAYTGILFHTEQAMNICFTNRDNPLPEVENFLTDHFSPKQRVKYLALYLTPFTKEETRLQEVKIYARIKQLLIQRKIACQSVEPSTIERGDDFKWSLTTMSVSILAKLGGIPWRLDREEKKDLIVGVGAFRHPDNVRYVGSAIAFDNTGRFSEFDYFMSHQTKELAGSIAAKVKEFKNKNGNPSRLIIHFYKRISEEDIKPIEEELRKLEFPNPLPIFIVSINKTYAKDIVAFDRTKGNPHLMPYSGTYIPIGNKKYLLFNSSRHQTGLFNSKDGVPFPVKLTIECANEKELNNPETVRELIDQVYQFSRMYWRSLAQQSLPVTVSYPEMVAEIAPHFEGGAIPEPGKDNLWFL